MQDDAVLGQVTHSVTMFRKGIFCPAELWNQLTLLLTVATAESILNQLPADLQTVLRDTYYDRPWSIQSDWLDSPVRAVIERWCQQSAAEQDAAADRGNRY
jgi:hypothetical protein